MVFIKLKQSLELLEGDNRKNIELEDDDNVAERKNWVILNYEEHRYKIPQDNVAFIRYEEDSEETEDLDEDTDILIS